MQSNSLTSTPMLVGSLPTDRGTMDDETASSLFSSKIMGRHVNADGTLATAPSARPPLTGGTPSNDSATSSAVRLARRHGGAGGGGVFSAMNSTSWPALSSSPNVGSGASIEPRRGAPVPPRPTSIPSLKVVVIGDYAVGKTSLIRQLTQRRFSHTTGTTIGVEFKEHNMQDAILQIWDVAGQQYSSTMTKQYYRGSAGAIVCVDVTKESSFMAALDWQKDLKEKLGVEEVEVELESEEDTEGASQVSPPEVKARDLSVPMRVDTSGTLRMPCAAHGFDADANPGRSSFGTSGVSVDMKSPARLGDARSPLPVCEAGRQVSELDDCTESHGDEGQASSHDIAEVPSPDRVVAALPYTATAAAAGAEASSSSHRRSKRVERCTIPVFLFANKGDLLARSTYTVPKIQEFARKHGFEDAIVTSSKDYASVRDAFQHVTEVLLEIHERNLLSATLRRTLQHAEIAPIMRGPGTSRVVRLGSSSCSTRASGSSSIFEKTADGPDGARRPRSATRGGGCCR